MKSRILLAIALLVIIPVVSAAPPAAIHFDGKTWWNYVKVLADDNMEGRETGSPGLQRAQAYVVEQLKQAGVEPAGENGYYQPVKFISRQVVEKDCSLALVHDGKTEPLVLGDDAMMSSRLSLAPQLEAPLVFVGYGLVVPEVKYDDLAGLDLKGKVVVTFAGLAENIPGPLASHYQSAAERWKTFKAHGIVGVISIPNPDHMDIPWSRMRLNRERPSMVLAGPGMDDTEGEQFGAFFNPASADKLFAGTGHTLAEMQALAKDKKQLPRFPLKVSIKEHSKIETKEVESANIVAKLQGSDPKLKNEYVVLSAHIDHLGVGEPINGDKIYNGAMDNASGSAVLLDVARALKQNPIEHKRSLLFVFVTAEEKGLLGSKYFNAHPTVPAKSMVGNINIDMFLPIYPLHKVTVYGLDESTMGDLARQAAEQAGAGVQADQEPERNLFIRSDQYNFIRRGIPAVAMKVAFEKDSPESKKAKDWLTNRYHAPSDDVNQPVDTDAAAKFEEICANLMVLAANQEKRPEWKATSFFKRYAQ